jgi:hypothetical protein
MSIVSRIEVLLENVAVSVNPHNPLLIGGEELIYEETAAIHHVGEALDPAVVVLNPTCRGEELVLAHDDAIPRLEMERGDVARSVTAERELAG